MPPAQDGAALTGTPRPHPCQVGPAPRPDGVALRFCLSLLGAPADRSPLSLQAPYGHSPPCQLTS